MPNQTARRSIVLASRSPARRELLQRAGFSVRLVEVDVPEPSPDRFVSARDFVLAAAWRKADAAAGRVDSGLIVAADTAAQAAGRVLGKPADAEAARAMLRLVAGSRHEVLTGLCLCRMPQRIYVASVEVTALWARRWSDGQIDAYLASGAWRDKAGAYAIREQDDPFIERLEGSRANVVGLPLERLEQLLSDFPSLLDDAGELP